MLWVNNHPSGKSVILEDEFFIQFYSFPFEIRVKLGSFFLENGQHSILEMFF